MDQAAAHELELYIDNDADLYRQQGEPILRNLANKAAQGKYDHAKAVKLYMYLMDNGAKKYAKEFASPSEWNRIFSVPTRKHVAEIFAHNFETEYKYGNYDNFLTKVSAKKKGGGASNLTGGHARRPKIAYGDRLKTWDGTGSVVEIRPYDEYSDTYRFRIMREEDGQMSKWMNDDGVKFTKLRRNRSGY